MSFRSRLIAFALRSCPAGIRDEFGGQIEADADEHRNNWVGAFDVAQKGLELHTESVARDIRFAIRVLRKAPLFSGVVVGTLAVSIAANAIIFSALDAVLLKPLQYAQADRLVLVAARERLFGVAAPEPLLVQFVDTIPQSPLVKAAGAAMSSNGAARVNGQVTILSHALVTPAYFTTLGVVPYLGRFFSSTNATSQAVISFAFWRAHYSESPSAIGKPLVIDDNAFTIVGIAKPGMTDPEFGAVTHENVWTLFPSPRRHRVYSAFPVVRLRPGVTIAAFNAEVDRLWFAFLGNHPEYSQDRGLFDERHYAQPLGEAIFAHAQSIWILFGAAAVVLLIACANLANLMLARVAARRSEFAVRAAMGATAARIARQNFTEAPVLCIAGCGVGLAIAAVCMRPALALIPGDLPRVETAQLDLTVVLYVCALGIAVTLLTGLLPALKAGSGSIATRRNTPTASALIAVEVGAAFTLLVCSGLLLRSFLALTSQPLGFDPQHVYVADFQPPPSKAQNDVAIVAQRVMGRIRALPNVSDAALTTQIPFTEGAYGSVFWAEGKPKPNVWDVNHISLVSEASLNYFSLMRIRVLHGRGFLPGDMSGPSVLVVNEAFVNQFFDGKLAVGKRVVSVDERGNLIPVIGVVSDTLDSLTRKPKPWAYSPFNGRYPFFQIVVRTDRDDSHLANAISVIAKQLYPKSLPTVASLQDEVAAGAADARAALLLLTAFTFVAVVLALAGIYSVVALSVERRHHEIGVRLALGATRGRILGNIVGAAIVQSLIGVGAGIIAAAFATRALESELFQTVPSDPTSFTASLGLLIACTALAAAIPAWRALRIDPARTLRYQ